MNVLKYNSINYAKYLNNCDINYKYFLKSINDTPVIDKIVFEFPTNMLPNMETMNEDSKNRMLLKCFIAFYFINFKMPYINCNRFKNLTVTRGTLSNFHYAYIANYTNLLDKYKLLSLLLNENDRLNASIKSLTNLNKKIVNNDNNNCLNFKLEVEASRVTEYKNILSTIFLKTELQNLKFKINIVFKNFNNKIVSIEEFKNFFYIWNI